ncbi:Alpha crystallin/Hsp20 domain [Macleaya cordata]|uniref:Alpha crystallin/Hsp20 domain n=1 Tax=Macleaya cordata TaxID=56857 RepID=A0A200R157_MACCD|nr:Alpha crystallin/Hsp20 domain [Macleaya cordata]
METKFQSNFTRSYEDFQPAFNWVREEGLDTLVLHLPGFKKEQLRVQVDSHGNMKISGERPLDENRWSRFRKDFPIPKNCNVNEIHAKFIGGLLYVKLPKKSIQVMAQDQPTLPQEAPVGQKMADEKIPNKGQATGSASNVGRINGSSAENGGSNGSGGGGVCSLAMHRKPAVDGLFSKLKKHRRLVVGVAVVVTTVVALGVYVACRLTSPALGEEDGN